MLKYIIKRVLLLIPTLIGIGSIVFFLLHFAPGDPARIILGDGATNEDVEAMHIAMGLDKPLIVQYGKFLVNTFLKFDFGNSYKNGQPIIPQVMERFPSTLMLCLVGTFSVVLVGVPLGVFSGVKYNTWIDRICSAFAFIGNSMPEFWFGLMLSYLFAFKLKLFPATGWYGPKYWVLPAITIAIQGATGLLRYTRSGMLDVIRQDYIRTARAKGVSERTIVWHHELKNALIPIVTIIGGRIGHIMGGSVVIESIFAIPGMGKFMLEAINGRDYQTVQACVILSSAFLCAVNIVVDIVYGFIDPRIMAQIRGGQKKKGSK